MCSSHLRYVPSVLGCVLCEVFHMSHFNVAQDFDNFMKGWQSQLDEAAYWVDPDDIEVSECGCATLVAALTELAILLNIFYLGEALGAPHPCVHICRALCQASWRVPYCGTARGCLRLEGAKLASLLTGTARWEASHRRQYVLPKRTQTVRLLTCH